MINPWDMLYYTSGWVLLSVLVIGAACALWWFIVEVLDPRHDEREIHRQDLEALNLANGGYHE